MKKSSICIFFILLANVYAIGEIGKVKRVVENYVLISIVDAFAELDINEELFIKRIQNADTLTIAKVKTIRYLNTGVAAITIEKYTLSDILPGDFVVKVPITGDNNLFSDIDSISTLKNLEKLELINTLEENEIDYSENLLEKLLKLDCGLEDTKDDNSKSKK